MVRPAPGCTAKCGVRFPAYRFVLTSQDQQTMRNPLLLALAGLMAAVLMLPGTLPV